MTRIVLRIDVAAPPERCFDLARSMDFHPYSMRATRERVVSGRASGLLELGDEVEFEGRHLGMTRRLRARITEMERPRTFVDVQVPGGGAFKSLTHRHRFEPLGGAGTRVTDEIEIEVGYGPLGVVAERLIVGPYLRGLVSRHQRNLRETAEAVGPEGWRRFLRE
ncbi:MAG TPA: SRPBCC family protein [Phycisphaerales bacterium]|nr:SRPBCC family protein [Phycisphaerales bacterium]